MGPQTVTSCTAFSGHTRVAAGDVCEVAAAVKEFAGETAHPDVLIFDDATAYPVEIDFRGSLADMLGRLPEAVGDDAAAVADADEASSARRGPGRPKLGVVAREVTLLPRHWEWLASQPGGASVTLRKLVEQARRENADADRARVARDVAYRFMAAVGGDLPGFEEVSRALFAGDAARFDELTAAWPSDVAAYARQLASDGLA